jgi:hypothetical protein
VTESLPPHCYSSVSREIGENSAGEVFENTLTSPEASLYDRCGFERPSVGFVGGVDRFRPLACFRCISIDQHLYAPAIGIAAANSDSVVEEVDPVGRRIVVEKPGPRTRPPRPVTERALELAGGTWEARSAGRIAPAVATVS